MLTESDPWKKTFRPIYEMVYTICRNTEEAMDMFSEALAVLDRNTILNMQEEMREEIRQKDEALTQKDEALAQKDEALARKDDTIRQLLEKIAQLEDGAKGTAE